MRLTSGQLGFFLPTVRSPVGHPEPRHRPDSEAGSQARTPLGVARKHCYEKGRRMGPAQTFKQSNLGFRKCRDSRNSHRSERPNIPEPLAPGLQSEKQVTKDHSPGALLLRTRVPLPPRPSPPVPSRPVPRLEGLGPVLVLSATT